MRAIAEKLFDRLKGGQIEWLLLSWLTLLPLGFLVLFPALPPDLRRVAKVIHRWRKVLLFQFHGGPGEDAVALDAAG